MNEVKTAFVEALERSAAALAPLVGTHELPGTDDIAGMRRVQNDPNFRAKWDLVFPSEGLGSWAQKLRAGEWPYFRTDTAADAIETIEKMVAIAASRNAQGGFVESIVQALAPLRQVVERYAVETPDGWRFPEETADPPPPPLEIPADPNIQSR